MTLKQQNVVDLVERHLATHQPEDYRLNVMRERVRQSGDWFYVVVQPSQADVRASDYNNRLSDTEEDIERQEHLKVVLVPILPD
ncbi:MAG: hypothetical protein M3Y28_10730 [Armatimonadota bacterium]|nr:hypothetical protein [Armatimonadota bacterium]